MAMTLKSLAAQMRAYRPEADEYKGKHIIPSWADALDAIDAHLSAQAKVQVNNAGLPRELRLVCGHDSRSVENCIHCEAADALESFAARLSQGTQGDGISVGVDVTNDGIAVVVRRFDTIIYSEFVPAERAAVPDGWVLVLREPLAKLREIHDDCEGVSYAYRRRDAQQQWDALTAAPQPPEGARVVDGWQPIDTAPKSTADGKRVNGIYLLGFTPDSEEDFDRQALIDIIWWEPLLRNPRGGRGVWRRSAAGESVDVEPTHWMPLPAAPTLAGKEGAK